MNMQTNPKLENLQRLVGKWNVELAFPSDPSSKIQGQATFDWLEGGAYVVEHLNTSTWIMGPDDSTETYYVLYHDERGVSRIYQMSLSENVWKLWRNAPGFPQRFEGKFSEEGDTITAHWEKSFGGSTWEHDFDLMYWRAR